MKDNILFYLGIVSIFGCVFAIKNQGVDSSWHYEKPIVKEGRKPASIMLTRRTK